MICFFTLKAKKYFTGGGTPWAHSPRNYACRESAGCNPREGPPLLAVPNVTADPPTANVPINCYLYDGPFLCSFNVAIKGLKRKFEKWHYKPYSWPYPTHLAGSWPLPPGIFSMRSNLRGVSPGEGIYRWFWRVSPWDRKGLGSEEARQWWVLNGGCTTCRGIVPRGKCACLLFSWSINHTTPDLRMRVTGTCDINCT